MVDAKGKEQTGEPRSLLALDRNAPFSDLAERYRRARARRRPGSLLSLDPQPVEQTPIVAERVERATPPEPAEASVPHAPPRVEEPTTSSPEAHDPIVDDPTWQETHQEAEPRPSRSRDAVRTLLAATALGALGGLAYALLAPRDYVATSEVLVQADAGADRQSLVESQARLMRSGSVLRATVERLDLAADPHFNGTARAGGLGAILDLFAGGEAGPDARSQAARETLARSLVVEPAGGAIVAVSMHGPDPARAALVANTIPQVLIEGAEPAAAEGAGADRLAGLRAEVEAAERAVEAYKAENELVDADGRLITDDEVSRLGGELSQARARTVELNARAASTRDADVDSVVTGTLPEQHASATLTELRSRHAGLKQQVDRLTVRLGPRHPERLAAEAELQGAREEISAELRRLAGSVQEELRRAVRQEQELAGELARLKVRQGDIGGDLVGLRELERDAEARRQAYAEALARAGTVPTLGSLSIVSRAEAPLTARGPSMTISIAGGALAGLVGGLGLVGVAAMGRRDEDEVELERHDPGEDVDTTQPALDREPRQQTPNPEETRTPPRKETETMHHDPRYAHWSHPAPAEANHAPRQPMAAAPGDPYAMHPGAVPTQPYMAYAGQPGGPSLLHMVPAYAASPQGWQTVMVPQMMQPQPAQPQTAQPQMGQSPLAQHQMPQSQMPQNPGQPVYHAGYAYQPMQMQPAPHQPASGWQSPVPHPQDLDRFPSRRADDARRDHEAFEAERTSAAIDEIRESLREFRAALESLSETRDPGRRYGT